MKTIARFLGRLALGLLLSLLCAAILFTLVVLHALRAAPGEWSHALRWGPFTHEFSVPALVRVASHPMTLRLLDGRSLSTPYGPLRWSASAGGGELVCAPCELRAAGLGDAPIRLERISFTLRHQVDGQLHGRFSLGAAGRTVQGRWSSRLAPAGAELDFSLGDTALADAYALFSGVMPEAGRARIEGRVSLRARLRLPAGEWTVQPLLSGFRVEGLGTEALLDAVPSCAAPGLPAGEWLTRAVIAAEDQRFHEHTGYDPVEMAAAWSHDDGKPRPLRGASTLSQQLAKLIYTGDARSPLRKLRELLYAVELDRTLGKARVLNLYLAMVPWGEGQCGAQAAARHYLGKDAARLAPIEAAWLASLLHNPDRERQAMARHGQVNLERVDWVMQQMRRQVPARQRLPAARWTPPPQAFLSLGSPTTAVASAP